MAKILQHPQELHFQEVLIEHIRPGQVVSGVAGELFTVKEILPTRHGFILEFESGWPFDLPRQCVCLRKGQQIL